MALHVVEHDFVDWEPLRLRFVGDSPIEHANAMATELETWFATNAGADRKDCDIRYYKIVGMGACSIDAVCEHLTAASLGRLASFMAKRFPELDRVEIGESLEGASRGLRFDWIMLREGEVTVGGEWSVVEACAISFSPVTIGQYTQFMADAGYTPICDRREYSGYLVDNFHLNFGKSLKLPLFGVTMDDASAFCDWAGLRLPSEPEMHHFFVEMIAQKREFKWHGACWTSTPAGNDVFVLRNGPYREESLEEPVQLFRKELHRHHYQMLEAPCFRVARTRHREISP